MKSGKLSFALAIWRIRVFRFALLPRYAYEDYRALNRIMFWKLIRHIRRMLLGHLGTRGSFVSTPRTSPLARRAKGAAVSRLLFENSLSSNIHTLACPFFSSDPGLPGRFLLVCSTVLIETWTSWLPRSPGRRLRRPAQGDSKPPCASRSVRPRVLQSRAANMNLAQAARGRAP